MRHSHFVSRLVLSLLLLLGLGLLSQGQAQPPIRGKRFHHPVKPAISKLAGVVVQVREVQLRRVRGHFVVLTLKRKDGKKVTVRVAPKSFLESQRLFFIAGQPIQVFAIRRRAPSGTAWLAVRIIRNGKEWRFRSKEGRPLWRMPARQ